MNGPRTASPDHADLDAPPADAPAPNPALRRFRHASLAGVAIGAVPYIWALWWGGRIDPLRTAWPNGKFSDFYDTQARALFEGSWAVPKGSLGIEAFVHEGQHFLYFGPFASILRMPVLAVTDALDGRLTAPSMLLAWVVTAVVVPLLLWRIRIVMRGPVAMSRAEGVSVSVFIAAVLGGSVLVPLASMPWVYHEDFAWSIALTIAALFALLGVLERPTRWRVLATGALVLCAVLNRLPTGWGCVIAAVLAAIWFATGRAGDERRRWWLPVLATGLVPLAVGCYITWAKFGLPFGLPMADQVWTRLSEHRQEFLAANGGKAFSLEFLPTTLLAYFRPDGLQLMPIFPFAALPAHPARVLGSVVFDHTYRTASIPVSMPLLFGLGIGGMWTAFRRRAGQASLLRIPILGALAGTSGVLVWGYIANRYLADFLPVLVIAAAVALVELWRRLDGRPRRSRRVAVTTIAIVGGFSLLVNLAVASTPTDPVPWEGDRIRDFVRLQASVGNTLGLPVGRRLAETEELPAVAPADRLFVVGDCAALYYSTGEPEYPWVLVDRGPDGGRHDFELTFSRPPSKGTEIPLISIESTSADLAFLRTVRPEAAEPFTTEVVIESDGSGRIRFRVDDPYLPIRGRPHGRDWVPVEPGRTYHVTVNADTALHEVDATRDGRRVLVGWTSASGEQTVHLQPNLTDGVRVEAAPTPAAQLCRDLLDQDPGQ